MFTTEQYTKQILSGLFQQTHISQNAVYSSLRKRESMKTVDDKYFLTNEQIKMLLNHRKKQQVLGRGFTFRIADVNGYSIAVVTHTGGTQSNWTYIGYRLPKEVNDG